LKTGRGLYSVSIIEDEDSYGRVVTGRVLRRFEEFGEVPSTRQGRAIEDHIVISLAGPFAEERFTGKPNKSGARSDVDIAIRLSGMLGHGSDEQERRYFDYLEQVASDLVVQYWPEIEHLARVSSNASGSRLVLCVTRSATGGLLDEGATERAGFHIARSIAKRGIRRELSGPERT
jgi:hypothetical protein